MTIQKLKQFQKDITFCQNGCKDKTSTRETSGYRSASHLIRFLDHDATYVCSTCAANWEKWWQELGGTVRRTMQRTKRDRGRLVHDVEMAA